MRKYNYKFRDEVTYGEQHISAHIYNMEDVLIIETISPEKCDLSYLITEVYDQAFSYSTVNILASAIKLRLNFVNRNKSSMSKMVYGTFSLNPSRLYIYNLARIKEKVPLSIDNNCMIESALSVLKEYGIPSEQLFDYIESNVTRYPPLKSLVNANDNMYYYKFDYEKLAQDLITIKLFITEGKPVLMGIVLFESLHNHINGLLLTPNPEKEKVIGCHNILLVGYDDGKKTFKFLNCWGNHWGNQGFGYILYDYVLNENIAGDIYALI